MRRFIATIIVAGVAAVGLAGITAARAGHGHHSCTSCTSSCTTCTPECRGEWEEKKSKKPAYSMTCEYQCVRGFDPWRAPSPECRCRPGCGDVIVKKKFFKADGCETVERVPKYHVVMVPDEDECSGCTGCCGGHDHGAAHWNPLSFLHRAASAW